MPIFQPLSLTSDGTRRAPRPGPNPRRQQFDRYGNVVDRAGPVRDGEVVRVPAFLADGANGDVLAAAKLIAPEVDFSGMNEDAIKRAAVIHRLGNEHDNRSQDFYNGAFQTLTTPYRDAATTDADAGRATAEQHLADGRVAVSDAYQAMCDNLSRSWEPSSRRNKVVTDAGLEPGAAYEAFCKSLSSAWRERS